jgi:transcriptional regulator with XRE-family HTH domain
MSDREREQSRNPLKAHEIPDAITLGALLRSLRIEARYTAIDFATRAQISRQHLRRIERALRHSRASTLARCAVVLSRRLRPTADELTALLIEAAGCSLAREALPAHQVNIDRRRKDRTAKKAKQAEIHAYIQTRKRELGLTGNPYPLIPIQGPDGKWLPRHPTPEQLAAIEKRYKHAHYVMPPLDDEGCFIADSPMLKGQFNARHWNPPKRIYRVNDKGFRVEGEAS